MTDEENDSEEGNPYQTIIINDFKKIIFNVTTSQIEQWSMLTYVINYVQDNRNHINYYK